LVNTKKAVKRKRVGASVNPNLWDKMRELADDNVTSVSALLDEAMEDLIKKYERRK